MGYIGVGQIGDGHVGSADAAAYVMALGQGSYAVSGQGVSLSAALLSLRNGLQAFWKMDESAGTRVDSHAGRDLSESGSVGHAAGIRNEAAAFTGGGSDALERSVDDAGFEIGSGGWTFSAWIYYTGTLSGTYARVAEKDYDGTKGWVIGEYGGQMQFRVANATNTFAALTPGLPSSGAWHHLMAWWDPADQLARIQIDGGTIYDSGTALTPDGGTGGIHVGNTADHSTEWPGRIDEVGIWSRVLSAGERAALFNGGSSRAYADFGGQFSAPLAQGAYALSGQSVSLLRSWLAALNQGAYALTGENVLFAKGKLLSLVQGSYALAGQALGLLDAHVVAIAQASYVLPGQNVVLARGRSFAIDQGGYVLSGQPVAMPRGKVILLAQGAYGLTGQAVALLRARIFPLAQGSYTLSGQTVLFPRGHSMVLVAGTYTLTGQAVALTVGHRIAFVAGSYVLAGQPVALLRGRLLVPVAGFYALTGRPVGLLRGSLLAITRGSYSIAGQAVALHAGAAALMPETGAYVVTGEPVGLVWFQVSTAPPQPPNVQFLLLEPHAVGWRLTNADFDHPVPIEIDAPISLLLEG